MFVALTRTGELIGPGTAAYDDDLRCPECQEPVRSKRGRVVRHHFAHLDGSEQCPWATTIDPWSEPVTRWHLDWQHWFSERGCGTERVARDRDGRVRRSDIVTPDGLIIEVQHSKLDVGEVEARERFWRPMIWIWDASWVTASVQVDGVTLPRLGWYLGRGRGWSDRAFDISEVSPHRAFIWRRPWHGCASASEPNFWDCGPLGVWWMVLHRELRESDRGPWWSVTGAIQRRMGHSEFVAAVAAGRWSAVAGSEPRRVAGLLRDAGIGSWEAIR